MIAKFNIRNKANLKNDEPFEFCIKVHVTVFGFMKFYCKCILLLFQVHHGKKMQTSISPSGREALVIPGECTPEFGTSSRYPAGDGTSIMHSVMSTSSTHESLHAVETSKMISKQ